MILLGNNACNKTRYSNLIETSWLHYKTLYYTAYWLLHVNSDHSDVENQRLTRNRRRRMAWRTLKTSAYNSLPIFRGRILSSWRHIHQCRHHRGAVVEQHTALISGVWKQQVREYIAAMSCRPTAQSFKEKSTWNIANFRQSFDSIRLYQKFFAK